jgi:hypothetical protein
MQQEKMEPLLGLPFLDPRIAMAAGSNNRCKPTFSPVFGQNQSPLPLKAMLVLYW